MKNNNLYNDKELNDDADLNWYDYGFRSYDPQIGRFPQLDPLTDDYPELTPYQYGSNDPIANIDVDGLEGFNAVQTLDAVIIKSGGHVAPTALSVSGSFLKGVGSSLWGAVTGIASAVAHPINTIVGLAHVVAHPIQTAKALGNVLSDTYDEFKNGNGNVKAGILGHAVGDIAQLFIGTGEAKAASEAIEVANVLEKGAKIVEETEVMGEVAVAAKEAEGIVYKRTNLKTKEEYYGQAKSDKHYDIRQKAHNKKYNVKHKYEIVERAEPGKALDVAEETHIRNGGGPKRKGGKLANGRYQMREKNYKKYGGSAIKPTN